MSYVELVSRSCYSLLDGPSQPAELVEAALQQGVTHLGLVDRDGVYGSVQAHKAAKGKPLTLIHGATLTVRGQPAVVLLVRNRQGWANLCRLITRGHAHQPKGRGEVQLQDLLECSAGLSCVLRPGWEAEAARPLREAFGEWLGVLLSRNLTPQDRARERWARGVAGELGVPMLASNDVRFAFAEQRRVADVLTCIRNRTTLARAGRALHGNAERHVLPPGEFFERYRDLPEAVRAAERFALACDFSLDELRYTYPREVVPEGYTPMTWLRSLVEAGAEERWPDGLSSTVRGQIEHELAVIEEMDFPAYFLTVYDAVRFARERGILCQGRGSAANSAVCYALGITAVDPSRSSLLFERFISKERGEPPDIDVDFEHERREEVIQYIYQRYGRYRAGMVNEFICYRPRSAVRDVGKVFGLSVDQVDRLAKAMRRWSSEVEGEAMVREVGLDPDALEIQQTLHVSGQIKGLPRHVSIHVGGFVIAADDLTELVPVEPATKEGRTVIQWDKYDVEALAFVKVDVLALGMLTAIRKAFDLVKGFTGRVWTLATVPSEDPAVYDMFCKADTVGVFQIESRAQMSMLPRLKPRCFYDLVVEVALVRPGPIQGGMVHPYLRRRSGEEPVTYAHPSLAPILERTLGVPLFQEQVMAMAVAVGGFTPGQADQLRRAMGAWRKRGNLDNLGHQLVVGMIERGITPEYAEKIFAQIRGFGEYGFPESHSASFALLVYVSGWLKCHHPAAFAAALINSQPMGFYSPRSLIADAQRHGVQVRPVCIQASQWDCTLESGRSGAPEIRLGFRLVQGFGAEHAAAIVDARVERPFGSLAEVARRTQLDRGRLQALAEANAFASLGISRRQAAWKLQGLWTELPLFAGMERREPSAQLPAESPVEALQADYRTVGLSVQTHPMELVREQLDAGGVLTLDQLLLTEPGARLKVAGLVSSRQRPGTASGVVFMTLEDETAMANLVVWPKIWERYRKVARTEPMLGVEGVLQRQGDAVSVLVESIWPLPLPSTHKHSNQPLPVRSRDFR